MPRPAGFLQLCTQPVTDKADVYSLAMIFYSLLLGAAPYPTEEAFKHALINKSRPPVDPSWHQGFVKVSPHDCKVVSNEERAASSRFGGI